MTYYKVVNHTIWFFRYLKSITERLLLHLLNKYPLGFVVEQKKGD